MGRDAAVSSWMLATVRVLSKRVDALEGQAGLSACKEPRAREREGHTGVGDYVHGDFELSKGFSFNVNAVPFYPSAMGLATWSEPASFVDMDYESLTWTLDKGDFAPSYIGVDSSSKGVCEDSTKTDRGIHAHGHEILSLVVSDELSSNSSEADVGLHMAEPGPNPLPQRCGKADDTDQLKVYDAALFLTQWWSTILSDMQLKGLVVGEIIYNKGGGTCNYCELAENSMRDIESLSTEQRGALLRVSENMGKYWWKAGTRLITDMLGDERLLDADRIVFLHHLGVEMMLRDYTFSEEEECQVIAAVAYLLAGIRANFSSKWGDYMCNEAKDDVVVQLRTTFAGSFIQELMNFKGVLIERLRAPL